MPDPIKKIMVKVKKKPILIPIDKLRAVADSLQSEGDSKWNKANGFSQTDVDLRRSSVRDTDNADRYRILADKAEKIKK